MGPHALAWIGGIAATAVAGLAIFLVACAPSNEELDALVDAVDATWPDSRADAVADRVTARIGRRMGVAEVHALLGILEDDGVVVSTEHEDPERVRNGKPAVYLTWKVVGPRGGRRRSIFRQGDGTFGVAAPMLSGP